MVRSQKQNTPRRTLRIYYAVPTVDSPSVPQSRTATLCYELRNTPRLLRLVVLMLATPNQQRSPLFDHGTDLLAPRSRVSLANAY